MPHTFYGYVTGASNGTTIVATVNNTSVSSTISDGWYTSLDVPADDLSTSGVDGGTNGDIINFTIGGQQIGTFVFNIGGFGRLDFNLTLPSTPASITNLKNNTYAQTYINWSWVDPIDANFSRVAIYLNGTFQTNVTKGVQFYNATSLNPDTSYTISTHTVDTDGNVNLTWVNHTARTAPVPTITLAVIYDNRLRESSPDAVLGGSTFIDVGHIPGTGRYRDVIWFDLSTLNTNDKITNATLSLFWYYPPNVRNQSTIVEIYRPEDWNQSYVNWNNRSYGTAWSTSGGDWFDKNNLAQGSVPYDSITFNASALPDNRYYEFNVTELVQGYVAGNHNNTGFFLKARDENDNYIAFYSSDWSNASQRPRLVINYTAGAGTPANLSPSITSFSPNNITPTQSVNGTFIFSVTTDQPVTSTWYLDGVDQSTSTQAWSHTWSSASTHNVTYVGWNTNGSVSITWNVSVNDTTSNLDVNLNGHIDFADLVIVGQHFSETTTSPYPRYDVNADGKVNVLDITLVASKI